MGKLADIPNEAPKHVLGYGMPKTGKTLAALKLAEHGFEIKYLGGENGHLVGKQLSKEAQERIDVINFPDTTTNPCFFFGLYRLFQQGEVHPCVEHGLHKCSKCTAQMKPFNHAVLSESKPNTIWVPDSLTQLSNSILSMIALKQGVNMEDWKPEWDDWRTQGGHLDLLLGNIQNSPYNWLALSHEIAVQTVDKKTEKIFPVAGTRNFSRNTAKYFDTVAYFEVVNGKHIIGSRTTYKSNVLTGDRMGVQTEATEDGLLPVFLGDRSANKVGVNTASNIAALGVKLK